MPLNPFAAPDSGGERGNAGKPGQAVPVEPLELGLERGGKFRRHRRSGLVRERRGRLAAHHLNCELQRIPVARRPVLVVVVDPEVEGPFPQRPARDAAHHSRKAVKRQSFGQPHGIEAVVAELAGVDAGVDVAPGGPGQHDVGDGFAPHEYQVPDLGVSGEPRRCVSLSAGPAATKGSERREDDNGAGHRATHRVDRVIAARLRAVTMTAVRTMAPVS